MGNFGVIGIEGRSYPIWNGTIEPLSIGLSAILHRVIAHKCMPAERQGSILHGQSNCLDCPHLSEEERNPQTYGLELELRVFVKVGNYVGIKNSTFDLL
jgi:hypothetical protein